ncbi:MAG: alanine racemase [Candidatus Vogelbacteria bacterium]|nr:alanine racemase [Candidatus Vogelbacteria bacterium]
MIDKKTLRTWVEIGQSALAHNYRLWRKLIGPTKKLLAVVKSNAYGHGLVGCAKIFSKLGADWLGVDSVEEATALRQAGIKKPILILGYTRPVNFQLAIDYRATITVSSFESLNKLAILDKKLKNKKSDFQLKIDTGMHRQGFLIEDLPEVIKIIRAFKNFKLIGIYSHLADASGANNRAKTKKQIAKFSEACAIFAQAGFANLLKHLSATGGTALALGEQTNMVRVGIGLYGIWPDEATKKYLAKNAKWFSLKPALTWKTIISEIKIIKRGEGVGYGFTKVLNKDSRLAICPVGYWHGYRWSLSNRGYVVIAGQRAPIVGRVSMDMIIIDITQIAKAKIGDEVTLLESGIDVYQFSKLAGSFPYEAVTVINPEIPRLYI